jgi:rhodanese-related sulfurtransferase
MLKKYMKQISVNTFEEIIRTEKSNPTVDFINVCTPGEYAEKHIDGVRSVPLDTLATHLPEFNEKKTIYVHCRSGNRSRKAIEELTRLGVHAELVNVEGGIMAWEEAGYATGSHTNRLPIMRQVFIGAGLLVLFGTVYGWFVDERFLLVPLFVSLGLLVSGITGWCGMALILGKMPWNK